MSEDPIDNPGTEQVAKSGDPKGNSKKRRQQLIRPEHAVQRSKLISKVGALNEARSGTDHEPDLNAPDHLCRGRFRW